MRGLNAAFRFFRRQRAGANEDELARAEAAIASADDSRPDDWLALTGDKQFLFSPTGRSFVAYAEQGRALAVAGAPVGRRGEKPALVTAAAALARTRRKRFCFYGVFPEDDELLGDAGHKLFKIGETALIDLPDYSIKGRRGDNLRATRNRMQRLGVTFEVAPRADVSSMLPALRRISDEWLRRHRSREKAFSLGFFSDRYLCRTPMAIARLEGEVVAFANLWPATDGSVLSFDLMRYGDDAPKAAIDFLIIELAHWGQAQGYQALDIGLAPLSGLDDQPHARMLARMGDFVFDTAERFYGFKGLRQFKDKFHPRWEPRFVAARNQWAAARALIDCALLTSGGWRPADRDRA